MKVNQDFILREVAGENFLIPLGQAALRIHGMIVMTESGVLLWKKLQTEQTIESLTESLLEEYDVDRQTAQKDVTEFIEKMYQIGILE
ncbi:MAG: PqqD family protein [Schaedlerella sp.]|nr:PqqD family protein [Lachnospiraceae bacterium]MDY4201596.1 PqqD family protein [Schaedlerella sp.]